MRRMTTFGFVGLGVMGRPMALNMARAGVPLLVWNRTPARAEPLVAAGADVARDVDDVFARTSTVLLMLANGGVLDATLGRGTPRFEALVRDHLVVPMGTTSPEYSAGLGADVATAGGRYVEAPVSGSRIPAENAALVGMLAGSPSDLDVVRPLLAATCRQTFDCGPVPGALRMKIAINLYLVTTVTALAESAHLARRLGVDLETFRAVLDAGQMASEISRRKLEMLVSESFPVAAALSDVLMNAHLVADAARASGTAAPLMLATETLFEEAEALGHGALDMAAIVHAIAARDAD
jgi:3-hydroxyisobutyrate dehydrogenase